MTLTYPLTVRLEAEKAHLPLSSISERGGRTGVLKGAVMCTELFLCLKDAVLLHYVKIDSLSHSENTHEFFIRPCETDPTSLNVCVTFRIKAN